MILDTNFIIRLRKGDPGAKQKTKQLEQAGSPLRVPTIVVAELFVGVGAGSKKIANQRAYAPLIANKPVVPLDENLARRAGVLEGVHRASNTKPTLGLPDAIVAATGLAFNEAVVTDDSDFQTVEGLTVETF